MAVFGVLENHSPLTQTYLTDVTQKVENEQKEMIF
jgi:hypothetical protein